MSPRTLRTLVYVPILALPFVILTWLNVQIIADMLASEPRAYRWASDMEQLALEGDRR